MRSTYQAIDAIYSLLVQAQNPLSGLGFLIRSTTALYDWQPGDFTVDGQQTDDGVYIYFDRTQFDKGMADNGSQSHFPRINLDIYTSVKASKSTSTDEIVFGTKRADRAIRNMAIELYDALSHSTFRRLMTEALPVDADWTVSDVHVSECTKIGVLRIPKSSKVIAAQRMVLTVNVCEIHDQATGVPYAGTDDVLTPYRTEDQL